MWTDSNLHMLFFLFFFFKDKGTEFSNISPKSHFNTVKVWIPLLKPLIDVREVSTLANPGRHHPGFSNRGNCFASPTCVWLSIHRPWAWSWCFVSVWAESVSKTLVRPRPTLRIGSCTHPLLTVPQASCDARDMSAVGSWHAPAIPVSLTTLDFCAPVLFLIQHLTIVDSRASCVFNK